MLKIKELKKLRAEIEATERDAYETENATQYRKGYLCGQVALINSIIAELVTKRA